MVFIFIFTFIFIFIPCPAPQSVFSSLSPVKKWAACRGKPLEDMYHHSWDYDFKEKPSLMTLFRENMSWSNTVREREGGIELFLTLTSARFELFKKGIYIKDDFIADMSVNKGSYPYYLLSSMGHYCPTRYITFFITSLFFCAVFLSVVLL